MPTTPEAVGVVAVTGGEALRLALHGGASAGRSHVLVVAVTVVGLWLLVAGLVVGLDRLLGRVAPE